MNHRVKCYPFNFEALKRGRKTFELRLNDQDYQVGDILIVEEFSPEGGYVGNQLRFEITCTLLAKDVVIALKPGFCILGLSRVFGGQKI